MLPFCHDRRGRDTSQGYLLLARHIAHLALLHVFATGIPADYAAVAAVHGQYLFPQYHREAGAAYPAVGGSWGSRFPQALLRL